MIHSTQKLTPIQHVLTLALADAHGHHWTKTLDLTPYAPEEGWIRPDPEWCSDIWCDPSVADMALESLRRGDSLKHLWGWKSCLSPEVLASFPRIEPGTVSPADIAQRVRSLHDLWILRVHRGVMAPVLGNDGDITHTTASGRTSWCVTPEGQVTVKIHRKTTDSTQENAVLVGRVTPQGVVTVTWLCEQEYLRRHLVALRVALLAVADPTDVDAALRPLLNSLMPVPANPSTSEVFLFDAEGSWDRGPT